MTKKELATIAGYTYRRLYDIDRDLPEGKKLFVAGEDGKYDLAIFVQKWVEYNVANEVSDDLYDLDAVKAKHEVIKAEKTQLEVDKMRGQLVDVQDVRRLWGDIANTVMQNLIHLPSKIAPMVLMMDNTELIASIISEEIRKILNEIADTPLPDYAAAEDTQEESEEDDGEV
jgi:phage terminase Nu1 subunit (DNA packaging protein)